MEKQWKSTVMGVIYALIIFYVAPIFATIFGFISDIGDVAGSIGAKADTGGAGALYWIFTIAGWAAFVWFFMNLTKFIALQKNSEDAQNVTKIRNAYIVIFVAGILALIPLLGWILSAVALIIGYVMLITGFGGLAKSTVLPEEAKSGAASLKTCFIIFIVAAVLGLIPLAGSILSAILGLVGVVLLFLGWAKIANNAPRA